MSYRGTKGTESCVQQVVVKWAKFIMDRMVDKVPKNYRDAQRVTHVVDKQLFNFWNIGLIRLVYPEAKIIHMVRWQLNEV